MRGTGTAAAASGAAAAAAVAFFDFFCFFCAIFGAGGVPHGSLWRRALESLMVQRNWFVFPNRREKQN